MSGKQGPPGAQSKKVPQQGGYPPQQGGYPPQQQGSFPPPQQGGYPPQQGFPPPQQGGYPPQQGGYPPQQGGYPPQQGGYPPQQQQYGGPPGYGAPPPQQYGGYGQQQGYGGPPPGTGTMGASHYFNMLSPQEQQQMQQKFSSIDKDRSGQISVTELASVPLDGVKFSVDTASLLIRVFDKDRSGQIGFQEFGALEKFINSMKMAFQAYDRDRSGSIEFQEVQLAVVQGGFQLSPQTLQLVYAKFLRNPALNPTGKLQGLSLEMFIQLCAFLGCARSTFSQFDYTHSGWIQINMDMFVMMSL